MSARLFLSLHHCLLLCQYLNLLMFCLHQFLAYLPITVRKITNYSRIVPLPVADCLPKISAILYSLMLQYNFRSMGLCPNT